MRSFHHRQDHHRQDGFSLIELLVVVIIIGILAAIAIPRYLDQREQANNAAAISDLRNLIAIETGLEATSGLTTDQATLYDQGWEASDDRIIVCGLKSTDPEDLLLTAWHQDGSLQYSWERSNPIVQTNEVSPLPASCEGGHDPIWPPTP